MNWLWINLGIAFSFLVVWFWLGPRLAGRNSLGKLLTRLILVVILTDCIVTLIGQPFQYWQDYSKFNEYSIIGKMLLAWHPLDFTLGLAFWVILATILIGRLSFLLSYVLFFVLFLGHALGAWSWSGPWLKNGLEFLTGSQMKGFWATFYWEFSEYLFYILLAFIFAIVLKRARHSK